jgi:hypothetical protein
LSWRAFFGGWESEKTMSTDDYEEPSDEAITPKPSELPANTVILDAYVGLFFKEAQEQWIEMKPEYRELQIVVKDRGYEGNTTPPHWLMEESSDEYFKDFTIISAPLGWEPPRITYNTMIFYDADLKKSARKTLKTYLPERKFND